jgi:hypothetical protein
VTVLAVQAPKGACAANRRIEDMPLFIALAISAGAACALLLYQFLHHTLEPDAETMASSPNDHAHDEALRAA